VSTPSGLIDAHAHLDMARFEADLGEVLERAQNAGVSRIITAGIDLPSSHKAIELAQQYPSVFAVVGIHPEEARNATLRDIETLSVLAQNPCVVGIGEIGLDYYRDYGPREKQIEVFRWQLDLALRLGLPVVIHARAADDDLVDLLCHWHQEHPQMRPGVIHCFNTSLKNARSYLELGYYLSLAGYIGYPSAKELRTVIAQLPPERLLVETDSPFLPTQPHRGERCEPAYVAETAAELARLMGLSLEDTIRKTTQNTTQVFDLS